MRQPVKPSLGYSETYNLLQKCYTNPGVQAWQELTFTGDTVHKTSLHLMYALAYQQLPAMQSV